MLKYSLVDRSKIRYDVRKLAYLYPSMRASTFRHRTDEWYKNHCLRTLEDVAKMFGAVVVPAACVHHDRRDASRRVMLLGRTYYIRDVDDITDLEKAKYLTFVKECDEDAEGYSEYG